MPVVEGDQVRDLLRNLSPPDPMGQWCEGAQRDG